jgi:CHAD domain-containing protein
MKEILERESKWEVADEFVLPALGEMAADPTHRTVELNSQYFDTVDRDLQTHRLLLRRRDGDDDTGWQLKIPDSDGRLELHWPLSDSVPAEIVEILTGFSLGKELAPVATIHTVRDRYRLQDPRDRHWQAELADDHVEADIGQEPVRWREIEIELGPDADSLPRRLVKTLQAAGARPARYSSKLARAVPPPPTRTPGGPGGTGVFADYLHTQIGAVFDGDLGLRRGHDPIHDTRVATRRLRSTLRVFGRLLDADAVGDVDTELKWFAGLLGEVRDCQVQRNRFHTALAKLPPELVLGPVIGRIDSDLTSTQVQAREIVAEAMNSPRYLDLLATLQRWRTDLPVTGHLPAEGLRKRAARAEAKADHRLRAALGTDDDADLHRARKAAKRARYAAELVKPLDGGGKAKRTVKRYKKIQTVLGDHQDSVVAGATLRRLGTLAGAAPGENGFTFGLLYADEQHAADQARAAAATLNT